MTGPQMRALLLEFLDEIEDVTVLRQMAGDEHEPPAKRVVCAEQADGALDDLAAAMAEQVNTAGARELVGAR